MLPLPAVGSMTLSWSGLFRPVAGFGEQRLCYRRVVTVMLGRAAEELVRVGPGPARRRCGAGKEFHHPFTVHPVIQGAANPPILQRRVRRVIGMPRPKHGGMAPCRSGTRQRSATTANQVAGIRSSPLARTAGRLRVCWDRGSDAGSCGRSSAPGCGPSSRRCARARKRCAASGSTAETARCRTVRPGRPANYRLWRTASG